nr:hypothetical protein FFPRI1PSEUD_47180 [Pseudomonas sp. FFPRI_1]
MSEKSVGGWFKPLWSVQNAVLFLAAWFIIALFDFNKSELASWVQAIGSIVAIWGAFQISNRQAEKQNAEKLEAEKLKSKRIKSVLLLLAKNQQEQLRLLHSTAFNAIQDFGVNSINPYLEMGWHLKWPPHIEALKSIAIMELDAGQVYMLNELKVASDFALDVCNRLPSWNVLGDTEGKNISLLHHYWEMAGLTISMLDSSQRESVQ